MDSSDRKAVVLGAGIAGLLAARVLSEFYGSVIVVDRDVLPDGPFQRKGIPQGRHVHNFLSRGIQVVGELFPGILDDMAAAGAVVNNNDDLSGVYARLGAYELVSTGNLADPDALRLHQASRPFMEFHIRHRLRALDNVTVIDNHDVVDLTMAGDAITAVRIANRNTDLVTELAADLVIDATGQATRTPQFLESRGFGTTPQTRTPAKWSYSSQALSIPDCRITQRMLMANIAIDQPRGLLLAYEHDSWMFSVARPVGQGTPPTDFAGMLEAAQQIFPAAATAELRRAIPLAEPVTARDAGAVWRRYDTMQRFPLGLLVFGDALCHLDPIHGQGMTMAALQALTLRECLAEGTADLAYRYFAGAAQRIAPVWSLNKINDADVDAERSVGPRWVKRQLRKRLVDLILRAASKDIGVAERLFRVTSLVDPPSRLQDPALLLDVLRINLRLLFGADLRAPDLDAGSRHFVRNQPLSATGGRHA